MKKEYIIILLFILIYIPPIILYFNKDKRFYLDKEYYTSNDYLELDKDKLNNLIKMKKSFVIFIHQPLCIASCDFEEVLDEFRKSYDLNIYKMFFSLLDGTELEKKILYYPSFVIYREGKVVDFLKADLNEHTSYYKNVDSFKNWITSYIYLKESTNKKDIEESIIEEEKVVIDNISYNPQKINIYFFWGNGCVFCKEAKNFFDELDEYKDLYTLYTFEVFNNKENIKILNYLSNKKGDIVTGVPYIIIDNESFSGFRESYKEEIINLIKERHINSYDIYFNN